MNSSTFNSDCHRRYVKWLYGIVFFPAFALYVLGIYLEPIYGDLTRVGLYDERSFGWQQPQLAFLKPLYEQGKYVRYHDMVVLGDSFSIARPRQQWQNYIVAATDWSVVTVDVDKFKWEKLLESQIFRDSPPKVLVMQSVERSFIGRIKDGQSCDAERAATQFGSVSSRPVIAIEPRIVNIEKSLKYFDRPRAWDKVKLGFVMKYSWKTLLRTVTGIESKNARKIDLTREAPFSSVRKREMLVYKEDVLKASSWREMDLSEMDCRIERIRKKVEANGRTKFVLMIAPDKLTAYKDFIVDRNLHDLSLLTQLSARHPDIIPRTDLALTAAIGSGKLDVYLPDDTHWGSTGHRIVAETVLDFLRSP
ncbi:hypothetical protein [Methylomicrobium sp. Wu6]|uniref:alginate O-acetyltransferase AlgX-related protein n=1 Tax=Methylomicrobium sp. Wu6 TaxID=3107928 RepID=UPI002DD69E77|nr:hypothetical protein [Methylomicrobium sp. Wu6]MEC4748359.1 hypothetical protein [Methylomicrobium sp. Wu6]